MPFGFDKKILIQPAGQSTPATISGYLLTATNLQFPLTAVPGLLDIFDSPQGAVAGQFLELTVSFFGVVSIHFGINTRGIPILFPPNTTGGQTLTSGVNGGCASFVIYNNEGIAATMISQIGMTLSA
jgi:hypothetical protein